MLRDREVFEGWALRILRDHTPNTTRGGVVKRWSDLHGDMQSQAEMT